MLIKPTLDKTGVDYAIGGAGRDVDRRLHAPKRKISMCSSTTRIARSFFEHYGPLESRLRQLPIPISTPSSRA